MELNIGTRIKHLWQLSAMLVVACLLVPSAAHADPADIEAASRGVVRVIIIEDSGGGDLYPLSHGTGFAVSPELIVTNAHVIAEARYDRTLSIGIVPSDGGDAIYGRLVAYSERNDLALLQTTEPMNLPPLTIAGNVDSDAGQVTAVGYPMNVDRAQGLGTRDIFVAQPPVKSQGFLSGRRPSRDFDTLLHTAPIARGNSGGPLLDNCGRVVGVNSFGTEATGTDSEFYFAVSTRELLPFLRANEISPVTNGLPCRSLADLNRDEQLRAERELLAAQRREEAEQSREVRREENARRQAEFDVYSTRENLVMLAMLLMMGAAGAGVVSWQARQREDHKAMKIAGSIAGVAFLAAMASILMRPGFDAVEERVASALAASSERPAPRPTGTIEPPADERLVCVVNVERSRITRGQGEDVQLTWNDSGCIDGQTQYGLMDGEWSRILVPEDEAVVSVATYDPDDQEYRVDRFFLGRSEMASMREARGAYQAPACETGIESARMLGNSQQAVESMLPAQPNERLVYDCRLAE